MRRTAPLRALLVLGCLAGCSPGGSSPPEANAVAPAPVPPGASGAPAAAGAAQGQAAGAGAEAAAAEAVAAVGDASPACKAFCERLFGCVPEAMQALALVKRTFPVDCAKRCATLDPAAVACTAERDCHSLVNGECGGEVGAFARNLGGP